MSRKWKNIIMSVLIVLLIGSTCVTVMSARKQEPVAGEMNRKEPDKMPEKPDGAEEGVRPELPDGVEEGEKPELPDGAEEGEKPELPDGAEAGEMPQPPEGAQAGEMPQPQKAGMSWVTCLLLGVQGLVILMLILYLILSGFNKKTFRETFSSRKRT